MTPKQVIEHYGGEQAVADALGITRQVVNYWKQHDRIPNYTQAFIELKSAGQLKAKFNGRPKP